MKRILAFTMLLALVLSLLTACGGSGNPGGGDNTDNASAQASRDVILASQLLSAEDATALLGQSFEAEDRELPYTPFTDKISYQSESLSLSVMLTQEALHDKDSDLENDLVKNGWESYMRAMERTYAENTNESLNIFKAEGVQGASAYMQEGIGFGQWLLHIFTGEYIIWITLGNQSMSKEDTEEEIAWKQAKLIELGNFAVERLAEILG